MARSGDVEVSVKVDVVPGAATRAWLERLGWTAPAQDEGGGENTNVAEPVEIVPVYPTGMKTDAGLRWRAAQRRADLRAELTEADQIKLDDLLRMFGADLTSLPNVDD